MELVPATPQCSEVFTAPSRPYAFAQILALQRFDLQAMCGYNDVVLDGKRTHREGKGAPAMNDIPNDDKPGFVAGKPEHCFACYRLIHPGPI